MLHHQIIQKKACLYFFKHVSLQGYWLVWILQPENVLVHNGQTSGGEAAKLSRECVTAYRYTYDNADTVPTNLQLTFWGDWNAQCTSEGCGTMLQHLMLGWSLQVFEGLWSYQRFAYPNLWMSCVLCNVMDSFITSGLVFVTKIQDGLQNVVSLST